VSPLSIQPLALTGGDPAGIGLEITLKAWWRRQELKLPPFFLIADPEHVAARADFLKLHVPLKIKELSSPCTHVPETALMIEPVRSRQTLCQPGQPDPIHGKSIIAAIERGTALVMQGQASALVTCPIAKKVLYDAGFTFPGHTEFLAHLAQIFTGEKIKPVMMLAGSELRTVPVTIHIGLAEVAKQLTRNLIIETALIVAADLRDKFGIVEPRLAVAGLNPHAGESGTMGQEDEEIVRPAIQYLLKMGIDVIGPLPADTLFHAAARKKYDVALCMYHDQALIPVKTLGFDTSVNVTLGLPFIRTSPDHGTAFDIAAQAIASPESLIAALRLAEQMAETKKACRPHVH